MPAAPQVVQFPTSAFPQTVPVQIPVSTQNGQTVYQTVQMQIPVQQMPQAIVQTSMGQQLVMQPQQFQPQMAQILTPNGQLQQVQVLGGMMPGQVQILGGGGMQVAQLQPQQQQQQQQNNVGVVSSTGMVTTQATTSSSNTTTTFATTTTPTQIVTTSTSSGTSANNGLIQPKLEPVETKLEADSATSTTTGMTFLKLKTRPDYISLLILISYL